MRGRLEIAGVVGVLFMAALCLAGCAGMVDNDKRGQVDDADRRLAALEEQISATEHAVNDARAAALASAEQARRERQRAEELQAEQRRSPSPSATAPPNAPMRARAATGPHETAPPAECEILDTGSGCGAASGSQARL